jgi:predicted branched-subunit amino acid permease
VDEIVPRDVDDPGWPARRRAVLRDALAVGAATGAYGLSYGALATTAGLSVVQASALSLLMFTGGSQFALVGVLSAGGGPLAAAAGATLLGIRNAFYGPPLSVFLRLRGARRLLAAHLVIDESTALAVGRADPRSARLAFWATGLSVFVLWNLATLIGAVGAHTLDDPRVLGLDAAAPAAFLALLAPRLRTREARLLAIGTAIVGVALTPLVPLGVPILVVAAGVVVFGLRTKPRTEGA